MEHDVEQVVRRAWQHLVPGAVLTAETDFFEDLAADSLRAITVTERVQRELEVDVSVQLLFDAPTLGAYIKSVAAAVARQAEPTSGSQHGQR